MKNKKELNALKKKAEKEKVETVKRELPKLTIEELEQVTGGSRIGGCALVDGNGAFAGC